MSEFYTVSQYAAISGKDKGNIRKMLIKGTLEGEKAGNQWLIPKNTKSIADKRIKSGKYRNWRKRVRLTKKYPVMIRQLYKMCEELGEIYQDSIEKIVLYGSYAKGQETSESDVDMAVILKNLPTDKQHDKMTDLVVDYELELGVTLSVISIEYFNFIKWKETLPFYKNIEKEGIILWENEIGSCQSTALKQA